MSGIHEAFSRVEALEPRLAAACSEIFDGDYYFVQGADQAAQHGAGQALLTNPDFELVTAHVAHAEKMPSGELKAQQGVVAMMSVEESFQSVMGTYKDTVGNLQKLATTPDIFNVVGNIPEFRHGGWKTVTNWFSREVAIRKRTLMTAHFIGRIAGAEGAMVTTLAYPKHIRTSLRFLIREMFIASLPEYGSDMQATIRDTLMDNEEIYGPIADATAAQQLLPSKGFRRVLRARDWTSGTEGN